MKRAIAFAVIPTLLVAFGGVLLVPLFVRGAEAARVGGMIGRPLPVIFVVGLAYGWITRKKEPR